MKSFIVVFAFLLSSTAFAEGVLLDNGEFAETPKGYKAVFVDANTPNALLKCEFVELKKPKAPKPKPAPAPTCNESGEPQVGPGLPECES